LEYKIILYSLGVFAMYRKHMQRQRTHFVCSTKRYQLNQCTHSWSTDTLKSAPNQVDVSCKQEAVVTD